MVNNPLPTNLAGEIKKASKTLRKFIRPGVGEGPDKVIPQDLLDKAKGLAIITIVKAGFIWSGRAGSGIVVARLPDGTWSGPSAIGTAGAGVGGQIGAEVTEYVFILNTPDAVKAFSLGGNLTLGANISVAAGPVGRTAEAASAVRKFAAVFSYSKSKGLFAGVSLEGSVIIERKDANAKFYGRTIRAKEILTGKVPAPPQAEALYNTIRERNIGGGGHAAAAGPSRPVSAPFPATGAYGGHPATTAPYAPPPGASSYAPPIASKPHMPPPRPASVAAPPPYGSEKMRALYDFTGERPGDLPFKAGDTIIVLQKESTGGDAGWWRGTCNGKEGSFPANYCQPM